jgi:hypothetical protein
VATVYSNVGKTYSLVVDPIGARFVVGGMQKQTKD